MGVVVYLMAVANLTFYLTFSELFRNNLQSYPFLLITFIIFKIIKSVKNKWLHPNENIKENQDPEEQKRNLDEMMEL
jgi:large-conductance mechanosensitive channel